MNKNKYARNVDLNQKEVVEGLREKGYSVIHLHTAARGVPDLIVCDSVLCYLVEVKSAKGKLTPVQKEFHDNWKGAPIMIAFSLDDLLAQIQKRQQQISALLTVPAS